MGCFDKALVLNGWISFIESSRFSLPSNKKSTTAYLGFISQMCYTTFKFWK